MGAYHIEVFVSEITGVEQVTRLLPQSKREREREI